MSHIITNSLRYVILNLELILLRRSRLGCQVKLTKELDGITATLPAATRNFFVDGKSFSFCIQFSFTFCVP